MRDFREYVRKRLPALDVSGPREAEIIEELAQHLEASYEAARSRGATHGEALELIAELLPEGADWTTLGRELRRVERRSEPSFPAGGSASTLSGLWQDVRYAARRLAKSPSFTTVALVTLAVGIGANAAVFSIADSVLVRPLPYRDAERLAIIRADVEGLESVASLSALELLDFRERSTTFEDFAGIWSSSAALTDSENPEQIHYAWATRNLHSMMGVEPLFGRHFTKEEEAPNGPRVLILSGELWRRRFGSDPEIVGRTVELDDQEHVVVGVLPPGFRLLMGADTDVASRIDAWVPQTYWINRNMRWLRILGKLRTDATFAQAQDEMNVIAENLKAEYTEYARHPDLAFRVVPLHRDLVRDVRPAVLALVGAVGFVLLIVCANIGSLLLARTRGRDKEIAIRAVLGASRSRVIRQLLTESLLLAITGGLLGLVLAHVLLSSLPAFAPSNLPRIDEIVLDTRIIAFAFLVSLASSVLFGVLPALQGASLSAHDTLKEGGRSGRSILSPSLRGGLVVGELAISFVLLIGAALMIQTFVNLGNEDLGFEPDDVLTMELPLSQRTFPTPETQWQFHRELQARIESLPGVRSSGAVSLLPLAGGLYTSPFAYDAESERDFGSLSADYRSVLPGYFETMDARLVAGRFFSSADSMSGRRMVIIDDTLWKQAWPSESPIGKRIKVDLAAGVAESHPEWMDVVGVVKHMRHEQMRQDGRPQIYFPLWTRSAFRMSVVVGASGGDPELLALAVQEKAKELGSHRPVHSVSAFSRYVDDAMAGTRFTVSLMFAFAAVAIALAAVGIYGVVSGSVSERLHELGIRMAVGASAADVFELVLRQGATLVLIGSALGVAGAFALSRFLDTIVFGVATTDVVTFAVVAILLGLVSLLACAHPAWRGSRVDPVVALRHD